MVSSKSSKGSVSKSTSSTSGSKSSSNSVMLVVLAVVVIILIIVWWFWVRKPSVQQKSGFAGVGTGPIRGYYKMAWEGTSVPTGDWDLAIWFGGEVPKTAIDANINNASKLNGRKKLLNLGGGVPDTGYWSLTDFDYINSKLTAIKSAGWDGLCFDVEVCPPNVSFVDAFKNCFANCKKAGLMVLVTISHTIPYQCKTGAGQGADLVNAWIADPNVDYISPQLYTRGTVLEPSPLTQFATVKDKILPSIPLESDFAGLADKTGLACPGYITWLQFWKPPPSTTNQNVCGKTASDAIVNCAERARCPNGTDSECPSGQKCWGQVDCKPNFCGKSWTDASINCATAERCREDGSGCTSGSCYKDIVCKPNFCGKSWTDASKYCKTTKRCLQFAEECNDGDQCYNGITCK